MPTAFPPRLAPPFLLLSLGLFPLRQCFLSFLALFPHHRWLHRILVIDLANEFLQFDFFLEKRPIVFTVALALAAASALARSPPPLAPLFVFALVHFHLSHGVVSHIFVISGLIPRMVYA
jgi:hypothetical protein